MALDKFGDIPITPQADTQESGRREKYPDVPPGSRIPAAGKDDESVLHDNISVADVSKRSLKKKPLPINKWHPIRKIRWFLVPVCVVVFYAVSSYFLVPGLIQSHLVPLISQRLERPVEIRRVVFSPFTLQLLMTDITIGNLHGDLKGGGNLLTASMLRCRLGFKQIFDGKLICEEVVLGDVSLLIKRDKTGSSDLADVLDIFSFQISRSAEQVWPLWLDAGELTLSGGTIVFNDVISKKQYRVEQVDLYFPGTDSDTGTDELLPQLSAVINSSPVRVEAVRILNNMGKLETGFDLHIQDVFLAGYLDYLPYKISQFRLSEGMADIDLRVVFPSDPQSLDKIVLSGESFVSNVTIVDADERPVIAIPEIRFGFTVTPRTQRLQIRNMNVVGPEIDVYAGRTLMKMPPGITMADVSSFIAKAVQSPALVQIEQMRVDNGKIRFFFPESPQSTINWDDVTFKLTEFSTPGWTGVEEGSKEPGGSTDSAYFALNVSDRAGPRVMKGSIDGQIHPGRGISGRLSVTQLNLARYGDLFPLAAPRFDKGIGDIRFTYDYVPGAKNNGKGTAHSYLLGDGYLDVGDYTLRTGLQNISYLSGGSIKCDGLQVDPFAKKLTCNALVIANSDIYTGTAKPAKTTNSPVALNSLQTVVNTLEISGSKLHTSILRDICPGASDLVLDNLTVAADKLNGLGEEVNFTVSATLAPKGIVKLGSRHSLTGKQGTVRVDLQNVDFRFFTPCVSQTLIPKVQQGELNARGMYSRPSGEFSGSMAINNLIAGKPHGPYVRWLKGETSKGGFRITPFGLDLGDVTITKPLIRSGLIDSDIPLDNFFKQDKPDFEQLSIDTITVEDGRFSMPWPIVVPGYQPELKELNGTLVAPGQDLMQFDVTGRAEGFASFAIQGTAEKTRVVDYSMEVNGIDFAPFASFFQMKLGLVSVPAGGIWYQDRTTMEQTTTLVNRVRLPGVSPGIDSSLLKVLSLLVNEKNELGLELKDSFAQGGQQPFLLPAIQRYLRHQAVRADISEQLILQESLPELRTPSQVFFEPGSSILHNPANLADYRRLLENRPLLGISLQSIVDEVSDRTMLQEILQQEADRKRDAKNRSRAAAQQKLLAKQKEMLGKLKEGKTTIVTEEISFEELAQDLEPLPFVRVEVPAMMLRELAEKRVSAVYDYLVNTVRIAPERVVIEEQYGAGRPQVQITPVPYRKTMTQTGKAEDRTT